MPWSSRESVQPRFIEDVRQTRIRPQAEARHLCQAPARHRFSWQAPTARCVCYVDKCPPHPTQLIRQSIVVSPPQRSTSTLLPPRERSMTSNWQASPPRTERGTAGQWPRVVPEKLRCPSIHQRPWSAAFGSHPCAGCVPAARHGIVWRVIVKERPWGERV